MTGGDVPYGRHVGAEIVEREAEAIRSACTALLNGASLHSIAREWNATGLYTVKGGFWSHTTARQVLGSPRNAGLQAYHGEVLEGVKTTWPAIVERDVWESVRKLLADPKRHSGQTPGRKHLLRSLALCGVCGGPILAMTNSARNGGRHFIYACRRSGCMRVARDLAKTDEYVVGRITHRLAQPDAASVLAAQPSTPRV